MILRQSQSRIYKILADLTLGMAELCRHLYNDNEKTFHYSTFLKKTI
jgi:hypothetical protein